LLLGNTPQLDLAKTPQPLLLVFVILKPLLFALGEHLPLVFMALEPVVQVFMALEQPVLAAVPLSLVPRFAPLEALVLVAILL
jgi:hypothetical protein